MAEAKVNLATLQTLQKEYRLNYDVPYFTGLEYGLDKCTDPDRSIKNELGFRLDDCAKSRYRYTSTLESDCATGDGSIHQGQIYPNCSADDEWKMTRELLLSHTINVIESCPDGGASAPKSTCVAGALPPPIVNPPTAMRPPPAMGTPPGGHAVSRPPASIGTPPAMGTPPATPPLDCPGSCWANADNTLCMETCNDGHTVNNCGMCPSSPPTPLSCTPTCGACADVGDYCQRECTRSDCSLDYESCTCEGDPSPPSSPSTPSGDGCRCPTSDTNVDTGGDGCLSWDEQKNYVVNGCKTIIQKGIPTISNWPPEKTRVKSGGVSYSCPEENMHSDHICNVTGCSMGGNCTVTSCYCNFYTGDLRPGDD